MASSSGLASLENFAALVGGSEASAKIVEAHSAFWASLGETLDEKYRLLTGDDPLPEDSFKLLMEYVGLLNTELNVLEEPYSEKEIVLMFFDIPPSFLNISSRAQSTTALNEEKQKSNDDTPDPSNLTPTPDRDPTQKAPSTPSRQPFHIGNLFSPKTPQLPGSATTKTPPRITTAANLAPISLSRRPFEGFPHDVILSVVKGFRSVLADVVSSLSENPETSEFNLSKNVNDRVFALLRHLEVLARYDANRDALIAHGVMDSVVTILDLSAATLIRLDDRSDSEANPGEDGSTSSMVDLKNIILSCMAVLARTADPESKWKNWVTSAASIKFSTTISASNRKPRLDSKFFLRITDIITTILLYFSDAESEPSMLSFAIRIGGLSTLGPLLIARPSTVRRHLLKSEGLKRLSELLSYPPYITAAGIDSIGAATLRSEFRAQMLLWNILNLLTRISGTCLRRLEESNGFAGISSMFRWVTFAGARFASDEEDYYPFFPLPVVDGSSSAFTAWQRETSSEKFERKELRILFGLALAICKNVGNPIEQEAFDSTSSPITGKFPKSHRQLLPEKEYSGEQSSHIERILRILVNVFTEKEPEGEVPTPVLPLLDQSDRSTEPLKAAFVDSLNALLSLKEAPKREDEIDSKDSLHVRRSLCVGWMESLGIWRTLYSPIFYDHPLRLNYLRDAIIELFVASSILPELPNIGAVSTLLHIVNPKTEKASPEEKWSERDREAACAALNRVASVSSETVLNALRRGGCLEIMFPLAFEENPANFAIRELCLEMITNITKVGPETAICIAGDKEFRQILLKAYLNSFETDDFTKIRSLLLYVTIQMLALPGSGVNIPKFDDLNSLVVETKVSKNQLSSEWMTALLSCLSGTISNDRELEIQKDLLKMIREFMRHSPPGSVKRRRIRHSIVSSRVFEHLLSILSVSIGPSERYSEEESVEIYRDLCLNTLNTIGTVITGSEFARKAFRELQGFDEIRVRVLHKGKRQPWPGFLDALFGLLVPRWMPLSPTFPSNVPIVIRNPDVLIALVTLFVDLPHEMQLDLLERLDTLAKGHEMNRVVMSQVGLGMLFLKKVLPNCKTEELVAKCIADFEIIANYSVTVAEAKALLRLLRHTEPNGEKPNSAKEMEGFEVSRSSSSTSLQTPRMNRRASGSLLERRPQGSSTQTFLPPFYDALLKCVRKLCQRKEADLDFFYFSGKGSGIVLPKLEKWPLASGGYTFFTWVKIEEGIDLDLYATQDKAETVSTIFSFRNDDGNGFELTLKDRSLVLTVYKSGKVHTLAALDYKLSLRRWHFIAVGQTAPKFPWYGTSEALIYVNGQVRASGKLEYPESLEYSSNRFGATALDSQSITTPKPTSITNHPEYDAIADIEESASTPDMASIYIVDDYMTTSQLAALFELGSNHSSQFRLEDAISYPDMEKTLFDGSLNQKIFFHLYSTAIKTRWSRSFCFDVSPKRHDKSEMINVISCSTRCLRSAIHALGGIEILLPLVTHLDYPTAPLDNDSNSGSLIETSKAGRVERLSTFLRILGVLIGDDSGHCDRLAVIKGPKIIGMLLQQQNPCCLTMTTLDTMMALSKVAVGVSGPLSFASELAADLQENLILDFRLWSLATPEIQAEYVLFLSHYLPTQMETLRSRYGISYVLDVLETFYWNTPPDHLPPDLLARLILSRPDISQISVLRSELFAILSKLTPDGILPDELSRLTSSLWMKRTDFSHIYDILFFITKNVNEGATTAVLECLIAQGLICELVIWLLSECNDERIRRICFSLILMIIKSERTPEKWRKKLRLEDLPGNIFAPSPSLNFGQIGSSFSGFLPKVTLNQVLYLSIMQIVIEEPLLDWFSDSVIKTLDNTARIKNIAYLTCLFELIHRTFGGNTVAVSLETIGFGIQIINDMVMLAKTSANAEAIRKISGWQPLLLQCLYAELPQQATPTIAIPESPLLDNRAETFSPIPEDSNFSETEMVEFSDIDLKNKVHDFNNSILKLSAMILYDSFETDKRAWRSVEETTVVMWLVRKFGERETAIKFIRSFLLFILREIRREIGVGHAGVFSSVKTENIWHFLLLSEEFMFHHHDLRDSLLTELKSMALNIPADINKIVDLEGSSLFYEVGKNKLPPRIQSLSRRDSDDFMVRISYPFEECREIVEECLEILSSFLEFGITQITVTENEKSHQRLGGLLRLEIRILLSALLIPDNNTWLVVLPYLMPLMDKHAQAYADTQSRQRILHVVGAVHNAFILAVNARKDPNQDLDYHIILPLYMLLLTRWQDYILSLRNAEGTPLITEEELLECMKTDEKFIELVTSKDWEYLYDQYLFPSLKQVEQEEFSIIPLASKRYVKVVKPVYVRWRKEEYSARKGYETTQTHVKTIATRKINEETSRVSERSSNFELERRAIMKQWLNNYRALTEERAIWAAPNFEISNQKWKLDRTENFLRMRLRLTQNYEFDDHHDAAARRDKVNVPGVDVNALTLQSSPRIERAMMAHNAAAALATAAADRRKAQVEKLRAHYESGSTNDLMREVSEGSLGSRVTEEDLEDEWNVVAEEEQASQNASSSLTSLVGTIGTEDTERFICGADCELILLMTAVKGRLELYNTHLSFRADLRKTAADLNEADQRILALLAESEVLIREKRWPINNLREVYLRRYMLRNSALELFFVDRTNHLFNFKISKDRIKFVSKISQLRPPNLVNAEIRNPMEIIKRSDYTERWQRHEISNFEYLMYLNTVSGRTYSDLTQYPVFPWIITDYTSKTIDLNDPSIYRDLSKPIGALNENRLEQYLERFRQFEDPSGTVKKFLYGTHYSTSAAVLFYLLRLEPFASLHIALQAGKFDHPDSDVKELIPEFFYLPEFLLNENKFDLGQKQTGAIVNDVILPEWASSPEEFIRIHREALEGDYVSDHLHEWIDLIWGYKQTGEEAVKANNVFYYLTYEGAINIDSVKDPLERKSIEDQINNFGQTPSQLFTKPHPQRLKREVFTKPTLFITPQHHKSFLINLKGTSVQYIASARTQIQPEKLATGDTGGGSTVQFSPFISSMMNEKQIVVTADTSLTVGLHRWFETNAIEQTYQFDMDPGVYPRRTIHSHFALNITLRPGLFAVSRDCKFMFSAGHWDSSFHVSLIDLVGAMPRSIDIVYGHHDIVTCLTISEDGKTLVTGSRDTTAMAWELLSGVGDGIVVRQDNRRIFYGHDDEVTTVAANVEHDLLVTGSKQKNVDNLEVQLVKISSQAAVVVYSEEVSNSSILANENTGLEDSEANQETLSPATPEVNETEGSELIANGVSFIHVYSANGKQLRSRMFTWKFHDIALANDGVFLVAADNRNGLLIMKIQSLQTTHRFDVETPVLTVSISENRQFVFMGRADGKLLLLALDKKLAMQ
ncbi:Neurobeachin-like protein 1 [Phlyctochytrium planicorne]|nr:Neurobeachin-like protein 1 [Phlyctochytrium planicorne]